MTSLIPWGTMSIVVVVFACLAGLVASILIPVLRHVRLRRELTHRERMMAVEVGQPMNQEDPTQLDKKFQEGSVSIAMFLVIFPIVAVIVAAWITSEGQYNTLAICWPCGVASRQRA